MASSFAASSGTPRRRSIRKDARADGGDESDDSRAVGGGAGWKRKVPSGVQTGSWGTLTHGAWAWAIEGGYQLPKVPLSPWLRAGWNRSSGDSNPNDDHHRTFFQLVPTVRTYARTPFFNQMNSSDAFLMLILRPHPRVNIRSDFHWLRVTEGRDLWYSGGGATSNTFFGYAGSPANGQRALARMADVSIAVTVLKQLVLEAYYGRGFGRSVVEQTFAGPDLNYGFLEMTFTY